jgi:diguanylate cyclase (GGDEF)-like protein/PAS domain S-box-containing protein
MRTQIDALRCALTDEKLARRESEERIDTIAGIVWEADPETLRFFYVSKYAERMLGYSLNRWLEEPSFWADHLHPEDRHWTVSSLLVHARQQLSNQLEYRMVTSNGQVIWIRNLVCAVERSNGTIVLRGFMLDISETKMVEQELRNSATRDALTGLPNRVAFVEKLKTAYGRRSTDSYAVLFLDLDRFKMVNDTLGHLRGDAILCAVANQLSEACGPRELLARLGGDEFAVLIEGLNSSEQAEEFARRLHQRLAKPITITGRHLTLSTSIGIALSASDCTDPQDLLRDADTAMYRAKRSARGSTKFFDIGMRQQLVEAICLENEIRRGLEKSEFEAFYQPIVRLEDGVTVYVEALMRWRHPEKGILAAGEFLPTARESGLAVALGWLVVRQAFLQAKEWRNNLGPLFKISVNISKHQFSQPNLVEELRRLMVESCVFSENLILEITEDVATNSQAAQAKLCELKELGFDLALDDFGTGRSSLSRLCRFPIDVIKIDRSFIRDLDSDKNEVVLVQAILSVARQLKMGVVAEGVETQEQRDRLLDLGCPLGQGYLFGRAMPAQETQDLISHASVHTDT